MTKDMPELSLKYFSYLRSFHGMPQEGEINDEQTKKLIQSYRACVSFVDAQIGLLLDILEGNNLMDNTIIVLWGDHGYKLGDYNNWDKLSNHDIDNNIPFIFTAPSMKAGQVSNSLVELVDVYPTLCDLAGLPLPEHLEGNSLLPLMKNPQSKVKDYAITQCQRGKNNEIMGYSIRSDKYRYTRWIDLNDPDKKIIAKELYDQSNGKIISENLADSPKYKRTAEELDSQLSLELSKYKTYKP
jgi:iduronate 2-sulfatase